MVSTFFSAFSFLSALSLSSSKHISSVFRSNTFPFLSSIWIRGCHSLVGIALSFLIFFNFFPRCSVSCSSWVYSKNRVGFAGFNGLFSRFLGITLVIFARQGPHRQNWMALFHQGRTL